MRRIGATVLVALLTVAAPAAAQVSVRDIAELAKAGLGEEVLIALVTMEPEAYRLDAEEVLELRASGVSEKVILAMIRHRRSERPQTPEPGAGSPSPSEPAAPASSPRYAGEPVAPSARQAGYRVQDAAWDQPVYVQVDAPPVAPPPAQVITQQVVVVPFAVPVFIGHPVPGGKGPRPAAAPAFTGSGRFINDGFGRFINDGFVRQEPVRR